MKHITGYAINDNSYFSMDWVSEIKPTFRATYINRTDWIVVFGKLMIAVNTVPF